MLCITDTKLFYILKELKIIFQIINDCAGFYPGLQTAGTDPGRRRNAMPILTGKIFDSIAIQTIKH